MAGSASSADSESLSGQRVSAVASLRHAADDSEAGLAHSVCKLILLVLIYNLIFPALIHLSQSGTNPISAAYRMSRLVLGNLLTCSSLQCTPDLPAFCKFCRSLLGSCWHLACAVSVGFGTGLPHSCVPVCSMACLQAQARHFACRRHQQDCHSACGDAADAGHVRKGETLTFAHVCAAATHQACATQPSMLLAGMGLSSAPPATSFA